MNHPPHRNTLLVEQAPILSHQVYEGDQYILRLQAPGIARRAQPGQFVHLQVDPLLPLRRPISILLADPEAGWIELLYKKVGQGTARLAERCVGEALDLLGPIGRPFEVTAPHPLLIGGGVGMPPMIFLAERLRHTRARPLVLLGSEVPFPFPLQPAEDQLSGVPETATATMPLLAEWGVPCRLASGQTMPGVFQGHVTDLARHWLESLDANTRAQVGLHACGPHPMLEAVTALARDFDLPVEVSLEEFMACGLGGCAGCVVEVQTDQGPAMQRVCVDGPVFDGRRVFG